jgi:hypothetical protein
VKNLQPFVAAAATRPRPGPPRLSLKTVEADK